MHSAAQLRVTPTWCDRTAWPVQLCRQHLPRHRASLLGAGYGGDDALQAAQQAAQQQQQQQPHDNEHAPGAYAPRDRKALWKAAIKLPMYSVGIVPVLVGAAAAYHDYGVLPWLRVAGLLGGATCVIAWLNLSNDAFDAATGVDTHKPESVVNLTGSRTGVLLLSTLFLTAGCGLLGASIHAVHDSRVAAMLSAAICCGYVYQGPPFRFSYKGLGEPLCFAAFGPLATCAFYLACAAHVAAAPGATGAAAAALAGAGSGGVAAAPLLAGVSRLCVLLSLLVGLTTTVILFCSHWHQIAGDTAAGKMSPLVRLGTDKACKVLLAATASPYVLALAGAAAGVVPLPLLLALLPSLPPAKALLDYARAHHTSPARIAALKKFGVQWHIAVGASLAAGLAACAAL